MIVDIVQATDIAGWYREVTSNLFASTQTFQGKQLESVEQLVRRDTKCGQHSGASSSISGTFGTFNGMSMVTSRTSHDNSFSCSVYENEAYGERAEQFRAEKKTKKRQLFDSVNQIILEDMQAV